MTIPLIAKLVERREAALDLSDIQGNVVRGYARLGFPFARYVFYRIEEGAAGRRFLRELLPLITSSALRSIAGAPRAKVRPEVTTDVAMSYAGLRMLGIPELTLRGFPEEFAAGMKSRCAVLGDDGVSAPEHWDAIWREETPVHLMIAINARSREVLERRYQAIGELVAATEGGVRQLVGHRGDEDKEDLPYQDAAAVFEDGEPTAKEHFGYVDGISNPYFKGCGAHPSAVTGNGKLVRRGFGTELSWAPLETGEFLLGYRDESGELPSAPTPPLFAKNGTFMAYRKLHENVGAFDAYLSEVGATFPGGKEALAAKFAGRWRNGAPLAKFASQAEADAVAELWMDAKRDVQRASSDQAKRAAYARLADANEKMVDFHYNDDLAGARCPMGSHTRRANPRAALEFGQTLAFETPSALANRRRIIRRGLPYGSTRKQGTDGGNHGIIFMAIVANLQRQFEFVQQQWINYGNDFRLSNERDLLLGNHGVDSAGKPDGRMIVPASTSGEHPLIVRHALRPTVVAPDTPQATHVRAGDRVFAMTISASFDPKGFKEPLAFDPRRPLDDYLHFGYGLHRCFGKYVVRWVLTAALKEVLRLGTIESVGPARRAVRYDGPYPAAFPIRLRA